MRSSSIKNVNYLGPSEARALARFRYGGAQKIDYRHLEAQATTIRQMRYRNAAQL